MDLLRERLSRITDLHDETLWDIHKALLRLRLSNLEEAETYRRQVNDLNKEYFDRFYSFIGDDNLKKYKELHERRLHAMKQAREQYLISPEGIDELEKKRHEAIENSARVIERSGVDLGRFRKLTAEHKKKLSNILRQTVGKGQIVLDKDTKVTSEATSYTAPYSTKWIDGCIPFRSEKSIPMPIGNCNQTDSSIGRLHSDSSVEISGADDNDEASIVCRTGMLIYYRMPSIGQLEVRARFELIRSMCFGRIKNECGWSEVKVTAEIKPYSQIIFPVTTERYYGACPPLWRCIYTDTNEDSHNFDQNIGFFSNRLIGLGRISHAFDEGDWLLVLVGIETVNEVWSNDCTVDSNINARFLLREVQLSSTGG